MIAARSSPDQPGVGNFGSDVPARRPDEVPHTGGSRSFHGCAGSGVLDT